MPRRKTLGKGQRIGVQDSGLDGQLSFMVTPAAFMRWTLFKARGCIFNLQQWTLQFLLDRIYSFGWNSACSSVTDQVPTDSLIL